MRSNQSATVRAVTEYPVRLVLSDGYFVDGSFVYRAKNLPKANQVIVVQAKQDPAGSKLARVARVTPDQDPPILATERP